MRCLGRGTPDSSPADRPSYAAGTWLFLRLLGLAHVFAFGALGHQLPGLIGSRGILPAASYLDQVSTRLGVEAYQWVPTVLWLDCSDAALRGLVVAGVAGGVLLTVGVLERWVVAPLVGLQGLIALTGNYNFFNLLTVALCLPQLQDRSWWRLVPPRVWSRTPQRHRESDAAPAPASIVGRRATAVAMVSGGCGPRLGITFPSLRYSAAAHGRPTADRVARARPISSRWCIQVFQFRAVLAAPAAPPPPAPCAR